MAIFASIVKPLAYLSLPYFLLRSISAVSPTGRYYTRALIYLCSLAGCGCISIVGTAILAALNRQRDANRYVARTFYAAASRILGIKVEVEGWEYLERRPAIIMGNHQSMLDILLLGRFFPKQTVILSKQSLRYTPIGPFMMLSGTIFIDRGNGARAIRSLEAATEEMKRHNTSLFIYPEGTRHNSPMADLLPFKKGGFHMAIQAGIPIVPVVAENYWHIWRPGFIGTGTIKIRVLPPIPTEGLTVADIDVLIKRVRDQMRECLREISVHARQPETTEEKIPTSSATSAEQGRALPEAKIAVNPPTPPTDISPRLDDPQGSSASLASSMGSSQQWRSTGSEGGMETEEDEGMILVGRPE